MEKQSTPALALALDQLAEQTPVNVITAALINEGDLLVCTPDGSLDYLSGEDVGPQGFAAFLKDPLT